MVIYELSHIFFRHTGELIYSPKNLGLYYSNKSINQAIQYYSTQPGFCKNQDAFSIRERNILGNVVDDTVFEVLIYLHTIDYEFETEIELGLYGNEVTAQNQLIKYCKDNAALVNVQNIILEKIINKRIVERKEWPEGFTIPE